MTTRFLATQYNHEQTGSEVSNSDSLIQEFQEFEEQAYSGKLFDNHGRGSSSVAASSQPCGSGLSAGSNQTIECINTLNSSKTDGLLRSQSDMRRPESSNTQCLSSQPSQRVPRIQLDNVFVPSTDRGSIAGNSNPPARHMQPVLEDTTCDGDDEDASDLEGDSLDEAECLTSALSSRKQVDLNPGRPPTLGHSLNYRAVQNARANTTNRTSANSRTRANLPTSPSTANRPQNRTSGSLIKPYDRDSTPVMRSAVSQSLSSLRSHLQPVKPSWVEQPIVFNQSGLSSTPLRRSESANFTAQPVASRNIDDDEEQLELVNPHPVLPHAKEDPIETHDQVVAEMAASGAVWAPPEAMNSYQRYARDPSQNAASLSAVDTRWYSAEIEEEQVLQQHRSELTTLSNDDDDFGQVTTRDMRQQATSVSSSTLQPITPTSRSTQNMSVVSSSAATKPDNHLSTPSQLSARNPSSEVSASFLSSYRNSPTARKVSTHDTTRGDDQTTKLPDESSEFVDSVQREKLQLKARLDQEIALRKQQDDYIRQLQKYYDNLLTKHALAEVTIDQLRMGAKTRSESEERVNGRANSQGNLRSSDLRLTDRFPHYRSQPLSALPVHRRGSVAPFGANGDQLLTCGSQSRYASTPMLISGAQQSGRSAVGSREWWYSSAQTKPARLETRTEDPNSSSSGGGAGSGTRPLSDRGLGTANRHIDWTYGSRKVASSEYLCGTVPEEVDANYCVDANRTSKPDVAANPMQQRLTGSGTGGSLKCAEVRPPGLVSSHKAVEDQPIPGETSSFANRNSGLDISKQIHDRSRQEGNQSDNTSRYAYAQAYPVSTNHRLPGSILDSEPALGPEEVHENLMNNVAELKMKLDHLKRRIIDQDDSLLNTDIRPIRTQYIQLKKCYHLAKRRWSADSREAMGEFDPDRTLDKAILQLRLQLDDVEACLQLTKPLSRSNSEAVLDFNDKSHFPERTAQSPTANSGIFTGLNAKYSTVLDSGVLSSPSRSDREHDLSSVSSSPISKDNLCALENLYVDLMDRYNTVKQHSTSEAQAGQLYAIMKRLYDLAMTVNGHSSVIPTPDELESVFQLDGDTRKLSEDLEKLILMERELSAYSSYSNVSGRDQYVNRGNGPPAAVPSFALVTSVTQPRPDLHTSTSNYANNESNRSHRDSRFTSMVHETANNQAAAPSSDGSSSAQDSGLSTPPTSEMKLPHAKTNNAVRPHHLSTTAGPTSAGRSATATRESYANSTVQSVNAYNTQGECPPDNSLPGFSQIGHNRWPSAVASTSTGSGHRVQSSTAVNSAINSHCTHSGAQSDVRDTTERRMEALEAGIRFLQQKLMEVCDQKQASVTSRSDPLTEANRAQTADANSPGVLYSSDSSKMASVDAHANRVRRVKKYQRSSVAKRSLQQQQQQQQQNQTQYPESLESTVHPGLTVASELELGANAGTGWLPNDRHALPNGTDLPMRFYGTKYNRWQAQNPPNPLEHEAPQHVFSTNDKVFNPQTGYSQNTPGAHPTGYHPNLANCASVSTSGGLEHPGSAESDDHTDRDSQSTDQDTCSPQEADSQDSNSTDCLEREQGISFHPHRDPKPRSILRRSSVKGSVPMIGFEPSIYGTAPRRTALPTAGGTNFDRSMSVAHDLHQLPPQFSCMFPDNHLGGSMPVLGDLEECDKYDTPHKRAVNALRDCRRRHQTPVGCHPPEGTVTPHALYRPPPPPKPAYLAEPHLVSTCGACGGSGRVSTPFQSSVVAPTEHIRRPLVPDAPPANIYGRRVLSFANSSRNGPLKAHHHHHHYHHHHANEVQVNRPVLTTGLVQDGSGIHRFGQTHIREYTEVGGRRYAVRELTCDCGTTPFPLMCSSSPSDPRECGYPAHCRKAACSCQLLPPTDISWQSCSSGGTSSTGVGQSRTTGLIDAVGSNLSASRPASEKIRTTERRSFPSAHDSALQRLLATANSVRALTRDLRKSLEDVCAEPDSM